MPNERQQIRGRTAFLHADPAGQQLGITPEHEHLWPLGEGIVSYLCIAADTVLNPNDPVALWCLMACWRRCLAPA